jgi:hypothetical protein
MTIPDGQINLPEGLAELHELYPRYEQALVTKGWRIVSAHVSLLPLA